MGNAVPVDSALMSCVRRESKRVAADAFIRPLADSQSFEPRTNASGAT